MESQFKPKIGQLIQWCVLHNVYFGIVTDASEATRVGVLVLGAPEETEIYIPLRFIKLLSDVA